VGAILTSGVSKRVARHTLPGYARAEPLQKIYIKLAIFIKSEVQRT